MMDEMISTNAKLMIETLINMHALANMGRATESSANAKEYLEAANRWLPTLERQMESIRGEFKRLNVGGRDDG